ncbi:SsgA family sporulation/cell division regulator [Kitasatospora sp. NPDC004240]
MDRITARTTMRLQTGRGTLAPVTAELSYTGADPYAVRCRFPDEPEPVTWVFGRDLLAEGLTGPSGEGDVRVEPAGHRHLYLALSEERGNAVALLLARSDDVAGFLRHTYRAVPAGTEGRHIDWEACVGVLLGRRQGSTRPR